MSSIRFKAPTAAAVSFALLTIVAAAGSLATDEKPEVASAGDFTLNLGGYSFDPRQSVPVLPVGWDRSLEAAGPNLQLVQLHGPAKPTELQRLRDHGVKIVRYIYPHTYIVWATPEKRNDAAQEPFVRWAGDFAPALRIQPEARAPRAGVQDVSVLLYRGADAKKTLNQISELGGRNSSRTTLDKHFDVARFDLPSEAMAAVAALPGVYSLRIRPTDGGLRGEMSAQIAAGNVDGGGAAIPGYPAWLAGVGVDGNGVIMANVDGGVNQAHPDLVNRFIGCTGDTCGGSATDSHGTHTAGIMGADGSSGALDAQGFLRGLGMAPGATMVEQLYNPTFTQAGGMLKLIRESSENNAVLSGNSWGPSGSPQGYDDDTMQVDIGVRDAQVAVAGNQEFTYVLSFMNGNGGTMTQGSPDEAKNLFTIGSTKAQNGDTSQILANDDLSANSAHGPARDGRTIPHMVAPGCSVDSTDTGGGGYGLKCGTSMASPHVAGAAALFFEYYRGLPNYTQDPSPALVKAAFLAVARNLAGNLDADGGTLGNAFDSKQGWGRMNLPPVIAPPANSVQYFDQETLFDGTGEEWVRSFSPLDPGEPVRIMLVWTDAPGHGLGGATPAWNNNLDLEVVSGGNTYLGNVFGVDGLSATGGSADLQNNTEGVFLQTAPGGINVRVKATDINSDGVPDVGDADDQDFALVCYNCASEPGFTVGALPTDLRTCAPADASFDLQIGSILGFSDPVTLSVIGVPAGASAAFLSNPVTPAGTSRLDLSPGTAGFGSYAVRVDGVSGGTTRSVNLGWTLDASAPAAAVLAAPADGIFDISTSPNLDWSDVPQAEDYFVQISTDPGFVDIVASATVEESQWAVDVPLATLAQHWWRVTASNSCGTGAVSGAFSFTTLDVPPILLVDDDDNSPNVRDTYTAVLDALGVPYDVWDTANSDNEPSAAQLGPYDGVIWFTGDEFGGVAGPGSAGETALAGWLDNGGCLLLASQDYHYDRNLTAFMQSHLGVTSMTNDVGQSSATGAGSVFGGFGPYTLSYPYTNYSDSMVVDASAEAAFNGSTGLSAVNKDGGAYRSTFWSFGLEAVADTGDRLALAQAFWNWCAPLGSTDSDGDGYDDDEDCAPADGSAWQGPSPSSALAVAFSGADNLGWAAPADPGATEVRYDVLRAGGTDFMLATCLETDEPDQVATDLGSPLPGEIWHYLVRTRNSCGDNLGSMSTGPQRPGVNCN